MTSYRLGSYSATIVAIIYLRLVSSINAVDTLRTAAAATTADVPSPDGTRLRGHGTNSSVTTNITTFGNSSSISCGTVRRSIDEFPPDYFTEEQRRHGAIIFHLSVAIYGFILITIVCNDYFLPSVFCICSDLGISPDVAGATFMATATCTSELIVSIIGTFLTKSDLGVGTVVGSGVYNTLGVSACAGLAASQAIPMHRWPLYRDSGVYVTALTVLAVISIDNVIVWYEALIMLIMYVGYFLFLFTQGELVTVANKLIKGEYSCRTHVYGTTPSTISTAATISESHQTTEINEPIFHSSESVASRYSDKVGFWSVVWWTFRLPVSVVLWATIPDCRAKRELYPFTFAVSIVWVSVVTYVLSWMLTICGDTFRINDIVMGIGVLAVGNSIPEAVSGIINAQNGEGSMSISSALGSNTMDILLCLGLPWFVKCLLPATMDGGPVELDTNSMFFNTVCMIVSVAVLNVAAVVGRYRMYRPFGLMCLVGQVIVIAVLIVNGLDANSDERTGHC